MLSPLRATPSPEDSRSTRSLALASCAALALSLSGTTALADDAPPPATAPAVSISDVVKLKNGAIFRGTILELVPNDHVDLKTASGETKRFPMSDVAYAGVSDTPSPPPPPRAAEATRPLVTVSATEVPVHFVGDSSDIAFHLRTGDATATNGRAYIVASSYTKICEAPCDAKIASGKYRFAVSQGGGQPIEMGAALLPHRNPQWTRSLDAFQSRLGCGKRVREFALVVA
jgi:hypothetical protein